MPVAVASFAAIPFGTSWCSRKCARDWAAACDWLSPVQPHCPRMCSRSSEPPWAASSAKGTLHTHTHAMPLDSHSDKNSYRIFTQFVTRVAAGGGEIFREIPRSGLGRISKIEDGEGQMSGIPVSAATLFVTRAWDSAAYAWLITFLSVTSVHLQIRTDRMRCCCNSHYGRRPRSRWVHASDVDVFSADLVMFSFTAGQVGMPVPCCAIKLVDVPELGYLAKDQAGEVCIRGNNVFQEYYKNPEQTAETLDEDG